MAPDPAKAWRDTPVVDAGLDGGLEALRRNPLSAAKLKLTLTRAEKLDLERRILAADLVLPSAMWVEKNGLVGNSERRTQQWFKMVAPPGTDQL